MIPLIVLGPSLLGFLLVVLFCCLTRKWRWLAGAFIVGLFLHFLSAAIQSELLFGERRFISLHGIINRFHVLCHRSQIIVEVRNGSRPAGHQDIDMAAEA